MTPEYYLQQMKIYSRFVRNFNPAQQEKDTDAEDRRRPRRRWAALDRVDRNRHEGLASTTAGAGTSTASRCTTTPS